MYLYQVNTCYQEYPEVEIFTAYRSGDRLADNKEQRAAPHKLLLTENPIEAAF